MATTVAASAIYPAQAVGRAPAITDAPVPSFIPRHLQVRQVMTTNTNDPESRPDFVGWYQTETDQAQYCDADQTWTSSGNYGHCCATTSSSCAPRLLCQSQTLMLDAAGVTWTCPSSLQCGTVTVFDQWPKSNAKSNVVCANENWSAWTMYRHISTTDSSSAPNTIGAGTLSEGQAAPLSQPSGTAFPNDNSDTTTSSDSKAWIAGAVIGPIFGLALIGGIAFLLWRRKRNASSPIESPKTYAQPDVGNIVTHEHHTDYKPEKPYAGYYGQAGYQGMSEADSTPVQQSPVPQELPTDGHGSR
ncbi:hypothetical protein EJ05DRAFT_479381 [Pseudovirgaria hyperparasitica]|uniref:Mid2 domain-containing protein n=1 Tax=Pseudovirgaria hyperparasitica TaxID=470096 RepID=A0A6A6VX17_9PEZI|nr:uncharacterized protein EJ05DRAFT_479381 [Pseudovirgaria hyperparasitica]KAF2754389.1 hypothetical protein EJ05DRAFT_479381 [Pseudovirgaria hyperparasitica]